MTPQEQAQAIMNNYVHSSNGYLSTLEAIAAALTEKDAQIAHEEHEKATVLDATQAFKQRADKKIAALTARCEELEARVIALTAERDSWQSQALFDGMLLQDYRAEREE